MMQNSVLISQNAVKSPEIPKNHRKMITGSLKTLRNRLKNRVLMVTRRFGSKSVPRDAVIQLLVETIDARMHPEENPSNF